jgi:hypothetical protein
VSLPAAAMRMTLDLMALYELARIVKATALKSRR